MKKYLVIYHLTKKIKCIIILWWVLDLFFIHLISRLASILSCTFYRAFTQLFHYSRLNVPTFVEDNPFGTIKHVAKDDVKYNTLFEKCTNKCNASFYKIHRHP
jgi:hypothetical protein